jgi:hypothetical protein
MHSAQAGAAPAGGLPGSLKIPDVPAYSVLRKRMESAAASFSLDWIQGVLGRGALGAAYWAR